MPISRRKLLGQTVAATVAGSALGAEAGTKSSTTECSAGSKAGAPGKPINLLFVFPDEMRAQAQGFMAEDPSLTPVLDRFAKEACVVRQAVTNYPLCTPSRGMFMTGQYPVRNGVTGNAHDLGLQVGIELSRHAICWSDVLKTKGYSLGYIGKWHLDGPREPYVPSHNNTGERKWNDWTPPDKRHGFDYWYAYGTYDVHMHPMYWTPTSTRDTPVTVDQWGPEHEADQTIRYLKNEGGKYRDPSKPFALVVSMNPPHSPYNQVPEKYLKRFEGKDLKTLNPRPNVDWDKKYVKGYGPTHAQAYLAMVNGVDEQFGRILKALDEAGLRDNTLVVFFSDHGCCLGSHGEPTKNNHYEESMRIPMLFRLPGQISPHSDDMLMSLPDLYPTILGLLGMAGDVPATVEGIDLSERVRTGRGAAPTSQLYMYVPYGEPSFGRRGVRTATHTLVVDRRDGEALSFVLHDNVRDPYQQSNIAEGNRALVDALIEKELVPWLERIGDSWRPVRFTTATVKRLSGKAAKPPVGADYGS